MRRLIILGSAFVLLLPATVARASDSGVEQSSMTGSDRALMCEMALTQATAKSPTGLGAFSSYSITDKKCDCQSKNEDGDKQTWYCVAFVSWKKD